MQEASALRPPARTNLTGSFCVTVLGAGRSGTSAVARALPAIGVELGDNLRRGRGKNPTGFWEDRDLLTLNKRLKRALGIRGDSVRLIEEEEWRQPAVRAVHDRAVATIRRRFGQTARWGYKYGRTLRLLPFWLDVYRTLGLEVRYVIALRNPLSVARSREQLDKDRGTQEKSDLEWLVNVVPYLHLVKDQAVVAVDYDLLMADPAGQLERMARALGITVTEREGIRAYCEEFLRPGLRHSRFTVEELASDGRIHPMVRQAYTWLYRLAANEIQGNDTALWQAWSGFAQDLSTLKPLLTHIDRVQAQLTRAQRSLLGPLQSVPELWRRIQAK